MVMVMILIFLVIGTRIERVHHWVIAGLTAAIALVLVITYIRF